MKVNQLIGQLSCQVYVSQEVTPDGGLYKAAFCHEVNLRKCVEV